MEDRPTKDRLAELCEESLSYSAVLRGLDLPINGAYTRKLKKWIKYYSLNISHFDSRKATAEANRKYPIVTKECPVCGNLFKTPEGGDKETTTCGHGCANTYFRTGIREKSPRRYREVCFSYHPRSCLVCGESKIVDVHHVDRDRENNCPTNLVPLCPTHHRYWHSKYRKEIEGQVREYLNKFRKTYAGSNPAS